MGKVNRVKSIVVSSDMPILYAEHLCGLLTIFMAEIKAHLKQF